MTLLLDIHNQYYYFVIICILNKRIIHVNLHK